MSHIESQRVRRDHFSGHWMAWVTLRHLLPAVYLRELLEVVIDRASATTVAFAQLFEEVAPRTPVWSECWLLRPAPVEGPYATYLQRLIRSFVWENDESGWPSPDTGWPNGGVPPTTLENLAQLSAADLGTCGESIEPLVALGDSIQESLHALMRAEIIARDSGQTTEPESLWNAIAGHLTSTPMPLRAIVLKHVADLCADVDEWGKALVGYERAQRELSDWVGDTAWGEATGAWRTIALQSRASALCIVDAPGVAADLLQAAMADMQLPSDPLLLANAGLDAWVDSSLRSPEARMPEDRRVSCLQSPLRIDARDLFPATRYWLNGKFPDAHRRFWAVLRRLVALGALQEVATAKALYARSLFEQLHEIFEDERHPMTFSMAARLLLESTRPDDVERVAWKDRVVGAYVDCDLVHELMDHAHKFSGQRVQRELVVLELFREWIPRMSQPRGDAVIEMWRHIAVVAREADATFNARWDLGRTALRALAELAGKRPEARASVATEVAEAVFQKLNEVGLWLGRVEALTTALAYVDVFEPERIDRIAEATLAVLAGLSPGAGAWPLVRPAIGFLIAEPVKRRAREKRAFAERVLEQIFRFGTGQESEHGRLFFYLHGFDPHLLREPATRTRAADAVAEVRRRAGQLNSSNVSESIYALILCPALSGYEGISDAVDGLVRVVESTADKNTSLGLPHAYDPVLLLVETRQKISAEIGVREEWLKKRFFDLLVAIENMWRAAVVRPLVFGGFALPRPTRPLRTVVHNWAFASMRLAASLGEEARISRALDGASKNPDLASGIGLARATLAVSRPDADDDSAARTDDPEVFYSALGRWLRQLCLLGREEARRLCEVLAEQCLRFGPHYLDAAVLIEADRIRIHEHVHRSGLPDYLTRLAQSPELRLALTPLIEPFREGSRADG